MLGFSRTVPKFVEIREFGHPNSRICVEIREFGQIREFSQKREFGSKSQIWANVQIQRICNYAQTKHHTEFGHKVSTQSWNPHFQPF